MTDALPLLGTDILQNLRVHTPKLVAETGIATLWQVQQTGGGPAALKIYTNGDMQDEAPGINFMRTQNGSGTAYIYRQHGPAVLMEWLPGPSLGDLVRAGDDEAASYALVETANWMHRSVEIPDVDLDPLAHRFQSLFTCRFAPDCPHSTMATLRRAISLAADLVATQSDMRPLHGDFHHDNIKGSPRGYLAFDAKGVFGDRHFELANAFWNPLDAKDTVRQRGTIERRAAIWAAGFRTEPKLLLQWAAAYAALSLSWTHAGTFDAGATDAVPYLTTLFAMLDDV